jgi:signal transduction histidine kinase
MYFKHKENLNKILNKSFFKITLIPLIVIEVTLLILYFGISEFLIEKGKDSLQKEIQTNLDAILEKEEQSIGFQLAEVTSLAYILKDDQEQKFRKKENILKVIKREKFTFAPNGVYYKSENDGGSSVFYGINHPIKKEQKDKAAFTKRFDGFLKYAVEKNELVVASYFNSYDDMNRLYPFIPKVYSQYDPKINMEDYNFYYDADLQHNPEKKAVWTNAYLDPAGQGWMVSCVVPIYSGTFLEGVTGLDITIDKFVNNILNLKLPWKGYGLLVSRDGTILAMHQKVEDILGLKDLKKHSYTDTIKETNFKPEKLNVIKNKKISTYFEEALQEKSFLTEKIIQNKEYIFAKKNIEQTGWKLIVLVDKGSVYEPINKMGNLAKNIGIAAIFGMILFYTVFFIFLSKKVQQIAFNIADPISKLANVTKTLSKKKNYSLIAHNNIQEIDTLLYNFQIMTDDLFSKREELEELNSNLEQMVVEEIRKNSEKENALLHQSRLAQLGEMISMIAHQWRQPLASISSIAIRIKLKIGLKKFDLDSEEGKEEFVNYLDHELDDVEMLIQNLTTTIDDFRDFYKPNKEAVLESVIRPLEKSLAIINPHIVQNEVEIIKKYEDNIKKHKLYVNELIQVFLNLIKNSIDAIKENNIENPHIIIQVKNIQNSSEENYVIQIDIIDNGGGMKPEVIENVFVPYFSTKEKKNGTGLGLYMSKTIIEKHHSGKMSVSSEDGNTTFTILL